MLSQDWLPIEPSFFLSISPSLSQAYSAQMLLAQVSLNRFIRQQSEVFKHKVDGMKP
jgi:predicted HicB family RNase H-like nuclease